MREREKKRTKRKEIYRINLAQNCIKIKWERDDEEEKLGGDKEEN